MRYGISQLLSIKIKFTNCVLFVVEYFGFDEASYLLYTYYPRTDWGYQGDLPYFQQKEHTQKKDRRTGSHGQQTQSNQKIDLRTHQTNNKQNPNSTIKVTKKDITIEQCAKLITLKQHRRRVHMVKY